MEQEESQMAVGGASSGLDGCEAKSPVERREALKGFLVRRLLLGGLVALLALAVWSVKYSSLFDKGSGDEAGERIHIAVDYANFLNEGTVLLPFAGEVYVGLRLAKAYPSGPSVCFRFDAYLRVKEEKRIGEFVVSAIPRIVGRQIELGEWGFVSFDVDDISADQVKSYRATGEAVFAMFKHKVKANALPIFYKATNILEMTSAEMVVQ